jgi:hypothetical protein
MMLDGAEEFQLSSPIGELVPYSTSRCQSKILDAEPLQRTVTYFKVGKSSCVGGKVVPVQRALCV